MQVLVGIPVDYGPVLYYFLDKARYWSKIAIFHTAAFDAPFSKSPSEYYHKVWYVKLEWCGYLAVKKSHDMFSCFDAIPACDRQIDEQTD